MGLALTKSRPPQPPEAEAAAEPRKIEAKPAKPTAELATSQALQANESTHVATEAEAEATEAEVEGTESTQLVPYRINAVQKQPTKRGRFCTASGGASSDRSATSTRCEAPAPFSSFWLTLPKLTH